MASPEFFIEVEFKAYQYTHEKKSLYSSNSLDRNLVTSDYFLIGFHLEKDRWFYADWF